ncbi:MAG: HRDC domain-containing protein [Actinobacteria bacterium]|nr:HRDC domain-containing protein [Actinomycetota bacterium]MCB9412717.1 HRDC domain-containing protein [Actinomycetota bacterium]
MEAAVPVLVAPVEPLRPVVATAEDLLRCASSLAAGHGRIAVDAERAGGYRYSQRAYLLQFNRRAAGTWLVDPTAIADFTPLADTLGGVDWVLHAASQDLPGLAELGLHPPRLFDTELAGRLLNVERVGLSAMTQEYLGVSLAKAHSAADWSRRPLPDAWLTYAALDVELLLDLADRLEDELERRGRRSWAQEEFEAVRLAPPPDPQPERWRRVKGLKTKTPRSLAVVRELWRSRDELAQELDQTPSKVMRDATIAAAASSPPRTFDELKKLPGMERERPARRRRWLAAVERALALPEDELPPSRPAVGGTPNPRSWERIDPELAAAYQRVRISLTEVADDVEIPRENLAPPRVVRDCLWDLRERLHTTELRTAISDEEVAERLSAGGARQWQVSLAAAPMATAMRTDGPERPDDITRE